MKLKTNKKNTLLVILLIISTMFSVLPAVPGEIDIRIIQGSVYIIGEETGPVEVGTIIKLQVSDGQVKTTTTKAYDEENDLNFGIGFQSIAKGEIVNFQIKYQGTFQEPSIIKINDVQQANKTLTITSDDIYHVNLYLSTDNLSLPTLKNPQPADDESNVSIKTNLNWECNETSILNPSYDVLFSKNHTLNDSDIIGFNITDKSFNIETLDYQTMYYWQIRVKDANGNTKTGPIWQFTTGSNLAPNKPTNQNPTNDSTNRPKNQEISWDCTDPDEDSLSYDIYFGLSNPPTKKKANHTNTTYNPGLLSYGDTYYWKIVAWDEHNHSRKGDVWHFTISENNFNPVIPTNPDPEDDESSANIDIELNWNGGDQDGDNVYYDVYLGTNSSPSLEKENISSTSYTPNTLAYNTTYYWKIITYDDEQGTNESDIWKFTTKTNESIGSNPATNLTADAGGPYTAMVDEEITFNADASTDDVAITGYRWDWTNDGTWDTDWLNTSTTTHSYSSAFTGKVKLQVKDAEGHMDANTASVTIETGNNPPTIDLLEGPNNPETNTTIKINFSATDPDGDQITYRIDWDDDSLASTTTGPSGTTISETHMYTVPGWYTVTVTASDPSDAETSDDVFLIVTEAAMSGSTDESNTGFPWIIVFILIILIAVAGVLFYLYQNDQLPYISKSSSESRSSFINPTQNNQSLPQQSMQSNSVSTDERKKTKIPLQLFKKDKSKDSSSALKNSSPDSSSEFKRL